MALALGRQTFPNSDLREIHRFGASLGYFDGEGG